MSQIDMEVYLDAGNGLGIVISIVTTLWIGLEIVRGDSRDLGLDHLGRTSRLRDEQVEHDRVNVFEVVGISSI